MAASVQIRPQNRDLGMVMREVDEDLAIFLGLRNGEKQRDDHVLVQETDEFDDLKGEDPRPDSLLASSDFETDIVHIASDDNFLGLKIDKTDYNWLLAQSDTSLLPLEDVGLGAQYSPPTQTEVLTGDDISPTSELASSGKESVTSGNSSLQPVVSSDSSSSPAATKKPIPSRERKSTSRTPTPTGRPSLPTKPKASGPSVPNSRTTLSSFKPADVQPRSSAPLRTTASRSSTPTGRQSGPPVSSKASSRSSTPTRKPLAVANDVGASASSGKKTISATGRNQVAAQGISPAVKSRPSKPSEMLSQSHDAPQKPKTLILPKRPASASRGRPGSNAAQLSSSANGKSRQQSCSPARLRVAPVTNAHRTGSVMLSRSRGHSNGGDDVNPVLMGTKMVERVVNMRKLAPPKQEEYLPQDNPKKSSQEISSGFGRSLSKKSLDMAIRHMDIRRSINENPRPVSTQAGAAKSCIIRATSESPLTSSSDCSSDSSISIENRFLNGRN